MSLVNDLVFNGYLKSSRIITAFKKIKRVDFLPEQCKDLSEVDRALPTFQGQTISQPAVVAFMIELLNPMPGDKILDIGSGSGWTTALLSEIVGRNGKVFGIEIIQDLVNFGRNNLEKYDFIQKGIADIICGDGRKGLKKEAPFDRILVSAAAMECPAALKKQLKIGGHLILPIQNSIYFFLKKTKDKFQKKEYFGFAFVPLIKEEN